MIAGTKHSIIGLEARGNPEMEEIGEYVSSKKGETGTPDDQSSGVLLCIYLQF